MLQNYNQIWSIKEESKNSELTLNKNILIVNKCLDRLCPFSDRNASYFLDVKSNKHQRKRILIGIPTWKGNNYFNFGVLRGHSTLKKKHQGHIFFIKWPWILNMFVHLFGNPLPPFLDAIEINFLIELVTLSRFNL